MTSATHHFSHNYHGSMPDGSTLEGSTLEGSMPEGSTLEGSTLEGSTLEGSMPEDYKGESSIEGWDNPDYLTPYFAEFPTLDELEMCGIQSGGSPDGGCGLDGDNGLGGGVDSLAKLMRENITDIEEKLKSATEHLKHLNANVERAKLELAAKSKVMDDFITNIFKRWNLTYCEERNLELAKAELEIVECELERAKEELGFEKNKLTLTITKINLLMLFCNNEIDCDYGDLNSHDQQQLINLKSHEVRRIQAVFECRRSGYQLAQAELAHTQANIHEKQIRVNHDQTMIQLAQIMLTRGSNHLSQDQISQGHFVQTQFAQAQENVYVTRTQLEKAKLEYEKACIYQTM